MTARMTIGVAVDIGEEPAAVVRHAVAWADHLDASLDVVTVSDEPSDDVALGELADQIPPERRGRARRLPVPRDEGEGSAISRALGTLDVDLLLVGTHARRGLDRLVFGSVAEPIVRFSRLPVLVCPLHAEPAVAPLVAACPVDPDELDFSAVQWVHDRLTASLHVLAAYPHESAAQQLAGRDLDRDVRQQLESGVTDLGVRGEVTLHGLPGVAGSPAHVLAQAAERIGVDLVALASHHRHGLARLWYGSVAEQVVREASCAVLVVPMADAAA